MRSAHAAPHLPRPGPPPARRALIIAGSTQSAPLDREMSALGPDHEPDNDRAYTPPTPPIDGLFYLSSHPTLNTVCPATGDVVAVGTEGVEEHTCQQGPLPRECAGPRRSQIETGAIRRQAWEKSRREKLLTQRKKE